MLTVVGWHCSSAPVLGTALHRARVRPPGDVLLFLLVARSTLTAPAAGRRAAPLLASASAQALNATASSTCWHFGCFRWLPFWLVNLGAGLAGMRLLPFATATAIGIVPGALLLTTIGAGLGDAVASGAAPDPWSVLTPRILLERFGLALLALAPVFWRRWRRTDG